MNMYYSYFDIFLLQIYLGSIVYLIGILVRFLLIGKASFSSFLVLIVSFIISVNLSLFFWRIVPMKDLMLIGFVNIPAILSELTLFIIQFVSKVICKKMCACRTLNHEDPEMKR